MVQRRSAPLNPDIVVSSRALDESVVLVQKMPASLCPFPIAEVPKYQAACGDGRRSTGCSRNSCRAVDLTTAGARAVGVRVVALLTPLHTDEHGPRQPVGPSLRRGSGRRRLRDTGGVPDVSSVNLRLSDMRRMIEAFARVPLLCGIPLTNHIPSLPRRPWMTNLLPSPASPPTSWNFCPPSAMEMPGMSCANPVVVLPLGIAWTASSVRMEVWVMVRVSTMGASDVTTIVSVIAPTARSAFTFAVNPVVNTIPSRRTVLNPGRANVTV